MVPVDRPLLLISQIQRSGGTLLSRLFDDHPACFAHPHELSWGRPAKWDWPRLDPAQPAGVLFEALAEHWIIEAVRAGGYRKDGPTGRFERHPFVFSLALQRRAFDLALAARRPAGQRDVLDAWLTAFFNAWLDYQSLYGELRQYVTAFTPRVNMHPASLAGFWHDYPDGRLVSIVRDPESWFASAQPHGAAYADIDAALALWTQSVRGTLDALAVRPSQVIVVLFDDLVERTEATMRRICASVGLSFTPTLVEPTFNGRPVESNSSFASRHCIDRAATGRGVSLGADARARILDRAGDLYTDVSRRFSLSASGASRETAGR
jgi:hypothetical protein